MQQPAVAAVQRDHSEAALLCEKRRVVILLQRAADDVLSHGLGVDVLAEAAAFAGHRAVYRVPLGEGNARAAAAVTQLHGGHRAVAAYGVRKLVEVRLAAGIVEQDMVPV